MNNRIEPSARPANQPETAGSFGNNKISSAAESWRDRKRYLWPLGLLVPLSPFLAWGAVTVFGLGLFWALGLIVMGVLIPLVDLCCGTDTSNPPENAVAGLETDRYYRWCMSVLQDDCTKSEGDCTTSTFLSSSAGICSDLRHIPDDQSCLNRA